ncbi:MAG TPA: hypothetical protein EYG51_23070, partial [Pseudomonadales bacterium]|nr:hypothetical protein [Pseudomonadales bacterium]
MAELTFRSPGVGTIEIDLSGPTPKVPTGVPAGIIGTAQKGPAFVPVTIADFSDFVAIFGSTDGEKFGPLAASEWFKEAQAGTYVRILGVGDGKKAVSSTTGDTQPGGVTRAGFIVGSQEVQANGRIGANPGVGTVLPFSGALGRTYFLGAFMSASTPTSNVDYPGIFREANIRAGGDIQGIVGVDGDNFPTGSVPILRSVLMAASGVLLSLSSSTVPGANNVPRESGGGSSGEFYNQISSTGVFGPNYRNIDGFDAGYIIGDVNKTKGAQNFTLLVNGLKPSSTYPNIITASFDPQASNYLRNEFNTDPTKIEDAGYYMYAEYPVARQYAVVTGSGIFNQISQYPTTAIAEQHEPCAFILTSSAGRNTSTATTTTVGGKPNFEGFRTRFKSAASPWVTSQEFGGRPKNLFRIHLRDDGTAATNNFKISIENLRKV